MRRVIMSSGGTGSWMTAQLVYEGLQPSEQMTLLFADTRYEDVDLYRFLDEAHRHMLAQPNVDAVVLDQGEDIWDVFARKRFIGNTRLDPCSYYLKRVPMRQWLEANCDVEDTICYLGIDWTEAHRFDKALKYWHPWLVEAPLCDPPYYTKDQILGELALYEVEPPALTREGFPHNNCRGGCVKGGQGHFAMLLEKRPDTFAEWEARENELRSVLGDVAILRDRRGGVTRPLPLTVLRRRVESGGAVDKHDIGGCACAVGDLDQDAALLIALE